MAERQEKDVPVVVVEERSTGIGGFLFGALLGAAAGLLFAPKSGEETQEEIREGASKLRSDAEEKLADLREELADVYERAREDVATRVDSAREEIDRRRSRAEEAVRTGRDVARSARDDLETRVEESKRAYREAVAAQEGAGAAGEASGEQEAEEGDEA